MPWENDNLDQDILQCRQDILKARQRLSGNPEPEDKPQGGIPIREIPPQPVSKPIDASFSDSTDEQTAENNARQEPQDENARDPEPQRAPSFEEVIHHHAQMQEPEDPQQDDTGDQKGSETQQPAHFDLQIDRKIDNIDLDNQQDMESAKATAEPQETPYDVTRHEIEELEKQWAPADSQHENAYLQAQHNAAPSPGAMDELQGPQTLDDEEDKILEELIHQSENYRDREAHHPEIEDEDADPAPQSHWNTNPEDEDTDIPSFDLAQQILARKRSDIARRRRGPSSPQKARLSHEAYGTVAEVINYSRKSRFSTQPDQKPADFGSKTGHSLRFDCALNPQSKSLIAEIVSNDIKRFFEQNKNPNQAGVVS